MQKKSSRRDWPQFPEPHQGIQATFCKFSKCANFGIEPHEVFGSEVYENSNINSSTGQDSKRHPLYATSGVKKGEATLVCKACKERKANGEITPYSYAMKNNLAIAEELNRISSYLAPRELVCTNDKCITNTCPDTLPNYKKRGKTAAGKQRYQCKECGTTFTDSDGSRKQRRSEVNRLLFELLMGKMPFRRIIKSLRIDPKTFYAKIDFIHKQCLKFAADKEKRMQDGRFNMDRLYLATDRQTHLSNWVSTDDKRNTEIYGVGTACLNTGYVFAFNFNYDDSLQQDDVESKAEAIGDLDKPKHHQRYARVWLNHEYAAAAKRRLQNKVDRDSVTPTSLIGKVAKETRIQAEDNRTLSSEHIDESLQLPRKGVLIHNEYTMLAHFFFLKKLFGHCEKTRFYLDLDSGLHNAFVSAFKDEIKEGRCEGFIVKADKNKTRHERDRHRQASLRQYKKITGVNYKDLSYQERKEVEIQLIKEAMGSLIHINKSSLEWLIYPIATRPEPEKMVAAITDISRLSEDHQAHLYRRASLHAIDRFFMKARRLANILERPIKIPSNANRVWYGYSPYNLAMYTKIGDIVRVFYNYCDPNDDGETPAMRLGLAKGPVKTEKVLYFGKYD